MGKIGEYRVTKEANADIRKVGEYTEKSWGKAQRRLYLTDMHEKFIQIANNPQMALLNKTFKPPVRLCVFQKHLIVYTVDDDGVLIVRVLHGKMNLDDHL